ncbi:MAG: universal stress protein [Candidatus Promineifilaceae bacterium]|nr:universal stress protein [Candidatus Promineifilaceae bacterium]
MNEIVCATRGGEGSRAVQLAAIEQAKLTGKPLVFLYVVAPEAVQGVNLSLQSAVREELRWLGRALLFVAEKRAIDAGLEVETVIREGHVLDEICSYLVKNEVSNLLLGAPRGTTSQLFGDDPVERFAADIHRQTGVNVDIIRPEDYTV